jgi:hypothetical protein
MINITSKYTKISVRRDDFAVEFLNFYLGNGSRFTPWEAIQE